MADHMGEVTDHIDNMMSKLQESLDNVFVGAVDSTSSHGTPLSNPIASTSKQHQPKSNLPTLRGITYPKSTLREVPVTSVSALLTKRGAQTVAKSTDDELDE